ncbi:hypothetical protein M3Y97_01130100 [Aphelenchoides bicaudatus]|nr:hypothetical protein M3Y97_01130100 [Aphelenchoides bicaudatus]
MTSNGFHYRRLSRRDPFRRSLFKILIFLFFVSIFYIWLRLNIFYFDYKPPVLERSLNSPRIAVISVVYDDKKPYEYKLAENTMECYTTMYNYSYIKLNLKEQPHLLDKCPGRDFMFRRHCVIANFLKDSAIDWILFIDSDMGVINPNHTIEEYLDESADLIFYDRLFNYEITAGSYLARNTNYTYYFLQKWASYEFKTKPGSYPSRSSDNGAIHEVYLDEFCSNCTEFERERCRVVWYKARHWLELFFYESCARDLLGKKQVFENGDGRLIQRSNAIKYWARDSWLIDHLWGPDDFILHGFKESRRNDGKWATWISPFLSEDFNQSLCTDSKSGRLNWIYNKSLMMSRQEARERLEIVFDKSYKEHLSRLKKVNKDYPAIKQS